MPGEDRMRAGLLISAIAAGWTLASSTAAVAIGLSAGTLVLVSFGLIGYLDAAGSITLVVHFRHSLRHEAFSERHERVALRVVSLGLIVVGTATGAESIRRLIVGVHGSASTAGLALAAASLLVLMTLAWRKVRVGRAIPSQALVADGWLSTIGATLAVVTLAGTALTEAGWGWVDPLAAAVVGAAAVFAGLSFTRSARRSPPG